MNKEDEDGVSKTEIQLQLLKHEHVISILDVEVTPC